MAARPWRLGKLRGGAKENEKAELGTGKSCWWRHEDWGQIGVGGLHVAVVLGRVGKILTPSPPIQNNPISQTQPSLPRLSPQHHRTQIRQSPKLPIAPSSSEPAHGPKTVAAIIDLFTTHRRRPVIQPQTSLPKASSISCLRQQGFDPHLLTPSPTPPSRHTAAN
ncbi:hypothetical protein M0R45_030940 [Rubus argutus]|uniref:Uncharacterized protein n=1 Tax=Rubus argutus TaxID=59490 RepID=A0AAW1WD09_RUBAR